MNQLLDTEHINNIVAMTITTVTALPIQYVAVAPIEATPLSPISPGIVSISTCYPVLPDLF